MLTKALPCLIRIRRYSDTPWIDADLFPDGDALLAGWSCAIANRYQTLTVELQIVWVNGLSYHGPMPILHWQKQFPSIHLHLRTQAMIATGQARPHNMPREAYLAYLVRHAEDARHMQMLLDCCDFGQETVVFADARCLATLAQDFH